MLIPAKKVKASRTKNLGLSKTLFTSGTRKALSKLRQVFVETSILNHFDPKYHISIEIDAFGYMINKILS